uniref:Uncharacterized protein n=1 Tax=Candidatus Kentrum sp. FM TaxID=2126340 RepID=A0A450VLZ2_9GAMM|nr:MAG: hypothetical protein BECKFM1743C_GA0114222_1001717 [Candidatus Kentron sp. FM]VFJ45303.1 MAG: hypothetical protein BECKFM1743A_GA0114220_100226 [Candidatus Kentron sp. FM]VFK05819.1 MAG: hypothetical protein BECKFM1743B_GA0114221_100056 [Candidatus Kentron sp. FM]
MLEIVHYYCACALCIRALIISINIEIKMERTTSWEGEAPKNHTLVQLVCSLIEITLGDCRSPLFDKLYSLRRRRRSSSNCLNRASIRELW